MALPRVRVLNLPQFDLAVKRFERETVPERYEELMVKVASFFLRRVVERTPVGDPSIWKASSLPPPPGYKPGRARGGWRVLQRNTTTAVKTIDPSGAATIDKGVAQITRLAGFGKRFFIVNNTPYIERLEDGYSNQAPNGMVALAFAETQARRFRLSSR